MHIICGTVNIEMHIICGTVNIKMHIICGTVNIKMHIILLYSFVIKTIKHQHVSV
jgi:hypothetical protein